MTAPPVDPDRLALAGRLADAARSVLRAHFRAPSLISEQLSYKDDASPVTAADRAAERAMRDLISAECPEDAIFGEEYGRQDGRSGWLWVLDPIDGTAAFASGRAQFTTLIALCRDDRPCLGVIDQPIQDERWIGISGQGASLNGQPIATRHLPLAQAMIASTAPELLPGDGLARYTGLAARCAIRQWGGDSYNYGLLAAGYLDLVMEDGLAAYDFAALVPVIEAAGGVITDWQGAALRVRDGRFQVLAAGSAALHREALSLISE